MDSGNINIVQPVLSSVLWDAVSRRSGDSYIYTNDLNTYITGLATKLSTTQKGLIDTFIKSLYSGFGISSLSEAFDAMYYLGNETSESSLRNLVKRQFDATTVGNPTFTQYEGFKGDGLASYIDTNFNPSSDSVHYVLDDALIGVYSGTENTTGACDIGNKMDDNSAINQLYPYNGVDEVSIRVNMGVPGSLTSADDVTLGMMLAQRRGAATLDYYKNKSGVTVNGISTAIPDCNIGIGARITDTTVDQFSDRQLAFGIIGKSLSVAHIGVLTDAFEVLMDARGKGVVA